MFSSYPHSHLRLLRAVPLVVLCAAALSAQQRSPPCTPAIPGTLVLDGAKNPELFPEWFKWEGFLSSLVDAPRSGVVVHGVKVPPLHEQLGVSEADLGIVLNEVKHFQQIRQTMEKQVRTLNAAMKTEGKPEDEIMARVHKIDLVYRYEILDARERIHAQIAPESLTAITRVIDQRLQGTTMYLRGIAKETFRLPW